MSNQPNFKHGRKIVGALAVVGALGFAWSQKDSILGSPTIHVDCTAKTVTPEQSNAQKKQILAPCALINSLAKINDQPNMVYTIGKP